MTKTKRSTKLRQSLASTLACVCLCGGLPVSVSAATTDTKTTPATTESQSSVQTKPQTITAGRLQLHGIFSNRYDHTQQDGVQEASSVLLINADWKFNDTYTLATTSEIFHCLRDDLPFSNSADGKLHDWNSPFFEAYVKGEFDTTTVKLGQFTYIPAYGITHGLYQEVSGGLVSFGKNVKTTIVAGTTKPYWPGTSANSTLSYANGVMQTSPYEAIDVVVPTSKATNIRALYERGAVATPIESLPYSSPEINFTECGFDTSVAKNLKLEAAAIHSTASSANNGTYASLKYKEFDLQQKKSFDTFVTYHNLESNAIMGNDIPLKADQKGIRYGVHYVPTKNTLATVWFDDVKVISSAKHNNKFRAQFDIFF